MGKIIIYDLRYWAIIPLASGWDCRFRFLMLAATIFRIWLLWNNPFLNKQFIVFTLQMDKTLLNFFNNTSLLNNFKLLHRMFLQIVRIILSSSTQYRRTQVKTVSRWVLVNFSIVHWRCRIKKCISITLYIPINSSHQWVSLFVLVIPLQIYIINISFRRKADTLYNNSMFCLKRFIACHLMYLLISIIISHAQRCLFTVAARSINLHMRIRCLTSPVIGTSNQCLVSSMTKATLFSEKAWPWDCCRL